MGKRGGGRPAMEPAVPVKDASELDASNAGSLSGTRRGNVVSLILPSDKAKKGDWVAIFLFPEESTPGWTQVDADNSVSIDVSNLSEGSYQLAVGDRESRLLGWAAAGDHHSRCEYLRTRSNDGRDNDTS